jgi:hypothetical protein
MGDGNRTINGYVKLLKVILCVGEPIYKKACALHLCNLLRLRSINNPIWKAFVQYPQCWNESIGELSLSILQSTSKDSTHRNDLNHMNNKYQCIQAYQHVVKDMSNEVFDKSRLTDGGQHRSVDIDCPEVCALIDSLKEVAQDLNQKRYLVYNKPAGGRQMYGHRGSESSHRLRPSQVTRVFVTNSVPALDTVISKSEQFFEKFDQELSDIFNLEDPVNGVVDDVSDFQHGDLDEEDMLLSIHDVDVQIPNEDVLNQVSDDDDQRNQHLQFDANSIVDEDHTDHDPQHVATESLEIADVDDHSTLSVNDAQPENESDKHLDDPQHHQGTRRGAFKIHRPLNSLKQSKERRQPIHVERSQKGSFRPSVMHSYIEPTRGGKVNSIQHRVKPKDVFSQKNNDVMNPPKQPMQRSDDDELQDIVDDDSEDSDSDETSVKVATAERPQRPANLRNLPIPKYNMLLRLNGTSVEMTKSAKKSRLG